eukprot:Seg540.7 transcript_id=Seg540.7/GoldUCD/mRNA.D3Y31 product="ATP-dependent DNA helicase PIF1" protein_id=Seg540.7/GoldUCD/D3Y31
MAAENIPEARRIAIETDQEHFHRLLAIANRAVDIRAPQIPNLHEYRLFVQQLQELDQHEIVRPPHQNQLEHQIAPPNIAQRQRIVLETEEHRRHRLQIEATRAAERREHEQPHERQIRRIAVAQRVAERRRQDANQERPIPVAEILQNQLQQRQREQREQRQQRFDIREQMQQERNIPAQQPIQRRPAHADYQRQRRIPRRAIQRQRLADQPHGIQLPQQHYLGPMNGSCPHCGARFFDQEKTTRNQYTKCCHQGKVRLPPIAEPSPAIRQLFSGNSPDSAQFHQHIRNYNAALAMASWNAPIVQHPGQGPKVVTIHGQAYHLTSPPDPPPGQPRKFAQLYVLDSRQGIRERLQLPENAHLRANVLQHLQDELLRVNPYVHDFQYMGELMRQQRLQAAARDEIPRPVRMIIPHRRERDRRYDEPSATEIAAVFVGEEGGPPNPTQRDIHIYPRANRQTITINAISPHADPMTYPILFPHGESGWHPDIRQIDADGHPNQNTRVSMAQFYAYRFADRAPFSTVLRGGLLFQQLLVDAAAKIEGEQCHWVRTHQDHLRVNAYQGLMDHVRNRAELQNVGVGRVVILPATFTGSQRNMHQNYQDSMAIVQKEGKPDMFITITVNPKSPEITEHLLPHQTANDRPDIKCRVFLLKVKALKEDLFERHLFGRVIAYVDTIEFQKRGLPHMHLLIFLAEQDKPRTPEHIDRLVSAEIPNPQEQPELYQKVRKHMIHGPCGEMNPNCICMLDGHCKKNFPKRLNVGETQYNVDGFPLYRRRNRFITNVRGHNVNDSFVVPYNPTLLQKYDCHINVEICSSIKSVKYIFKYIHKGYDCTHLEIREGLMHHDEILEYLNAQYLGPHEAYFKINGHTLHHMSHSVERLAVHLPLQQNVYFREGQEERALEINQNTTLTAWFELNNRDPEAREYLYHDIPEHYTLDRRAKKWKKRQRAAKIYSRMYQIQPSQPEKFSLRMLLLHCSGALSFQDLRTVEGHEYPTFQDAARAMGLLQDDTELHRCLEEAHIMQMPRQMRALFATILLFNPPSDPHQLFLDFQDAMSEDFVNAERRRMNDDTITFQQRHMHLCLFHIDIELNSHGKSIHDEEFLPLPQLPAGFQPPDQERPVIDITQEQRLGQEMLHQLNQDQRHIADIFLNAINSHADNRCFFVDGSGGTGKTFLYNTLVHILRGMEIKVKCIAYSGIAGTLLIDGSTAHSTFQLPIPLTQNATCNVSRQSYRATDLTSTSVFIWDEASMVPALALKKVDMLLRDLTRIDAPFGGKFMFLGGDFRQVLPVMQRASREQIVNSSLKKSPLWHLFHQFRLLINMRANQDENYREFADWLLRIGDAREPMDEDEKITLPHQVLLESNTLPDLIDFTYPQGPNGDPVYMSKRCCLTPKNINSHVINDLVLERLPGNKRTYLSVDSVVTDDQHINEVVTIEFLNSMTPSGMPLHKLDLKVGATVILLRNLNPKKGLCNGTRLIIRDMQRHVLAAEIIANQYQGQYALIPRITLAPQDENMPFQLSRRQFPIRLAYCLTINKAQGQSLESVGVYLPEDVFSHGQLYVAFSRATSFTGIKAVTNDGLHAKNIVYPEVLN